MTSRRLARRPITVAASAAVAILVLAAPRQLGKQRHAGAASSAGGPSATVTIQNFAFTPQALTVKTGTAVTWTNNDSAPHTVTSAAGISTSAGTYYCLCTIHKSQAGMHGEIIVQ